MRPAELHVEKQRINSNESLLVRALETEFSNDVNNYHSKKQSEKRVPTERKNKWTRMRGEVSRGESHKGHHTLEGFPRRNYSVIISVKLKLREHSPGSVSRPHSPTAAALLTFLINTQTRVHSRVL